MDVQDNNYGVSAFDRFVTWQVLVEFTKVIRSCNLRLCESSAKLVSLLK